VAESQPHSRFVSPLRGRAGGYLRIQNEREHDREDEEEEEECSWGLEKDMKLFEVSAKDDRGLSARS
jgi:hypothetical protein